MKKNNMNNIPVTLNSYIANVRWANSEDLGGARSILDFITKMENYKPNEIWYVTLWEEKYGPNIHVIIEAGNDVFTIDENGFISANPETDTQHYYVTARILGSRNGPFEDVIDTIWVDEEYPDIDREQAQEILGRLIDAARDYIKEEVNKLPTLWVVEFQSRDDEDNPCYHVNFKSYKKAKAYFDECVAREKNPEISWVGEIYEDYKDPEKAPDEDYEVNEGETEFSATNNINGIFVSWTLTKEPIF